MNYTEIKNESTELAYNQGLKDMMECQRKIAHMSKEDICKCFEFDDEDDWDKEIWKLKPDILIEQLKEWEEKNSLHIEDEVIHTYYDDLGKGVITKKSDNVDGFNVLWENGNTGFYYCEDLKKTGKKIYVSWILRELQKD